MALEAYGAIDELRLIPKTDPEYVVIHQRKRDEERMRILQEERERREQREREFQQQLREQPVVFQRDPEGSINLVAFANDPQNIHRSSVQNTTHKAVLTLLKRPVATEQQTVAEITEEMKKIGWRNPQNYDMVLAELNSDYVFSEAFSVKYADVLDRVWSYIRTHEHKDEIAYRLAQELYEGRGMCSNGKMARLVNVLQGYDETLHVEPPRELFQDKIALLLNIPKETRETEAHKLFVEFNIPESEHAVWLEPLLE